MNLKSNAANFIFLGSNKHTKTLTKSFKLFQGLSRKGVSIRQQNSFFIVQLLASSSSMPPAGPQHCETRMLSKVRSIHITAINPTFKEPQKTNTEQFTETDALGNTLRQKSQHVLLSGNLICFGDLFHNRVATRILT
jgi:hypothetical protein